MEESRNQAGYVITIFLSLLGYVRAEINENEDHLGVHSMDITVVVFAFSVFLLVLISCVFYKRKSFDITQPSKDFTHIRSIYQYQTSTDVNNGTQLSSSGNSSLSPFRSLQPDNSSFTTDARYQNRSDVKLSANGAVPVSMTTTIDNQQQELDPSKNDHQRAVSVISLIPPDEISSNDMVILPVLNDKHLSPNVSNTNPQQCSVTTTVEKTEEHRFKNDRLRAVSVISLIPPDEISSSDKVILPVLNDKHLSPNVSNTNPQQQQQCSVTTTVEKTEQQPQNEMNDSSNVPEYSTIDQTKKRSVSTENIVETKSAVPNIVQQTVNRDSSLSIDDSHKPDVPPKTPESMQFID